MKVFSYAITGALVLGLLGVVVGNGEGRFIKKSKRAEVDKVNIPTFGIVGAVIGLVAGGLLGNKLQDEEEQQLQKAKAAEIEAGEVQAEKERMNSIFLKLGIINYHADTFKEGRYWIGLTKWVDPRVNKLYTIRTERSGAGTLATSINGKLFMTHSNQSAHKDTISVEHESMRNIIFRQLTNKYQENNDKTVDEVFRLPAEQA